MKTTLLLHTFLFIQLFGYASRMEESFLLKNDTVTPNPHSEMPVTFPGEMPIYPDGDAQMLKDIQDNLVYPELEKSKGIQGVVFVEFYVEIDGTVSNVKTVRGITNGKNIDLAAEEAVKKLKKFSPAKHNGKPTRQVITVPVRFRLPKETDIEPKK